MSTKALTFPLFLLCFFLITITTTSATEFLVGGKDGWAVPKSKDEQQRFFNDWASSNRFQVNDTLRFKYEKDSVMVVNEEEEYNKCRSSHPAFYYNNGDTSFTVNRPGLFYFISGTTGHCDRGLKMIVKVLDVEDDDDGGRSRVPPSSQPAGGDDGGEKHKSAAAAGGSFSALVMLPLVGLAMLV